MRGRFTVFVRAACLSVFMMGLATPLAQAINVRDWGEKIPNVNARFQVLNDFEGDAVLDRETQLVWEQSPATTTHNWVSAKRQCADRTVSNRKGWRLPSVFELATLLDPSVPSPGPRLPPGHPFANVQSDNYWAATRNSDTSSAWNVNFILGLVLPASNPADAKFVWCVRGGQNHGSDY